MSEDVRCCETGTCILDAEGLCWCGQQWDGNKMGQPPASQDEVVGDAEGAEPHRSVARSS